MKIARTFKSASPCDLTSMGHFSFPSFLFLSVGCARLLFLGRSPLLSLSLFPSMRFLPFAGRVATFKLGVVGELLEKSFARFGLERASERACARSELCARSLFLRCSGIPSWRVVAFYSARRFRASRRFFPFPVISRLFHFKRDLLKFPLRTTATLRYESPVISGNLISID